MDELIIGAVFSREPLWNPSHEFYKNVGVLKKLWLDVSKEVNKDEKTVRIRWKNIRAYFYKELRKLEKPKSGDRADRMVKSSWPLFDQLMFLKDKILVSPNVSNLSEPDDDSLSSQGHTSEVNEDQSHTGTTEEQVFSPASVSSDSMQYNHQQRPKKKPKSSLSATVRRDEQLLELEKQKVDIVERETGKESNDDLLFFQSLLPFMKEIPLRQKLQLRSKIQNVILDELNNIENTTQTFQQHTTQPPESNRNTQNATREPSLTSFFQNH